MGDHAERSAMQRDGASSCWEDNERNCMSKLDIAWMHHASCSCGCAPHHAAMTIEQITARICAFRDARDWMQFHSPKELAIAITAEAGELLQHFVWQQPGQIEQRVKDKMPELKDEMADVGILLFELAHNLGVDLGQAMLDKVERNETRYPVAKARGSNAKYNEL